MKKTKRHRQRVSHVFMFRREGGDLGTVVSFVRTNGYQRNSDNHFRDVSEKNRRRILRALASAPPTVHFNINWE